MSISTDGLCLVIAEWFKGGSKVTFCRIFLCPNLNVKIRNGNCPHQHNHRFFLLYGSTLKLDFGLLVDV